MQRLAVAAGVAAVFALFALVWTFPLVTEISTALPGDGPGDNVAFLWNFWWMREARASGADFFSTPYLFAPLGVDLALHTHTAAMAWFGALPLGGLSILAAQNLTILASLWLNGCSAYLFAREYIADRPAALFAALVFAGSPFISAHLHGHFNLVAAWPLPLFALGVRRALPAGSLPAALVAGVVLGLTFYVDYYYVICELGLFACFVGAQALTGSVHLAQRRPSADPWALVVLAAIAIDLIVIGVVVVAGGFTVSAGGIRLSVHSTFNPLQVLWILVAIWSWLAFRPRVSVRVSARFSRGPFLRALVIGAVVSGLIAAPILWHGLHLGAAGDYVTQRYFWRGAPAGIDAAALVLGNPFHGVWGDWVLSAYRNLHIDVIESCAWLGVAPLVLLVRSARRGGLDSTIRFWVYVGAGCLLWSLGPHLIAGGIQTGMILPETAARYIPIVDNARIPGRAMIVVYLALAVVAGSALAHWRRHSRHPALVLALALSALAIDFCPAPFPVWKPDRPSVYTVLRDRPEPGAVCELPLGYADGFGESGVLDRRVLFYQTIHRRPILGGFVSRLSKRVEAAYHDNALIAALLSLSAPDSTDAAPADLPSRDRAADLLERGGIRFLMLNRDTASPRLIEYVSTVLPVTEIAKEGGRSLYIVSK